MHPFRAEDLFYFDPLWKCMVWIELGGSSASAYVDVTKICAITSTIEERKINSEDPEYILHGTVTLHSCGFFQIPIWSWDYDMGVPKINKRIKNSEKQNEEITKWKKSAFQKAKFKHNQRVFKIVHNLELIKNEKDKHVAYRFMQFLDSIDSTDL
jgi:hypothetical protein